MTIATKILASDTVELTDEAFAYLDGTLAQDSRLLGYLHGERSDGSHILVCVYKDGLDFRLSDSERSITCLPSVVDIEGVKNEALGIYGVWRWVFEPVRA